VLKPCLHKAVKVWAVDKIVGNVKNKGPHLVMSI